MKKGSKEAIMKYFGTLADKGIDWDEKEKRMKEFRRSFSKRMNKTRKYMEGYRKYVYGKSITSN